MNQEPKRSITIGCFTLLVLFLLFLFAVGATLAVIFGTAKWVFGW